MPTREQWLATDLTRPTRIVAAELGVCLSAVRMWRARLGVREFDRATAAYPANRKSRVLARVASAVRYARALTGVGIVRRHAAKAAAARYGVNHYTVEARLRHA